jgi:acyl-CoA synthetase (AMP-forming)/AMP-acid ligase II
MKDDAPAALTFRTLDRMCRDNAATWPDRPALVFKGTALSFAGLDERASRLASRFAAAGLGPGDRLAILCKNNVPWFELLLACAKTGVVFVPVNFRLAPREVEFIVNDATAKIMVVDGWFADIVREIEDDLTTVEQTLFIAGHPAETPDRWLDYETWRDAGADDDPGREAAPEDPLIQMYTSGTTGLPKGAVLSHANINAMQQTGPYGWDWQADVSLVVMPLFHIAGSAWALSPMSFGVTCIVMEDVEPGEVLRHIGEDKVTKVLFVPAVILFLMQHPDCKTTDFSTLKLVTYGASPIPLDLLQQAVKVMGCDFMQLYGMTEATGAVTYLPAADHDPAGTPRMRGVGIPIPPSQIRVVDPDGRDLAPGEVGEILVRSPQVMLEYWNRPEATAEAVRDGWYWSGDAGFFDEDGYLYMHDRIKDMVISGGENVYPAEVESCLFEHEGVADVGVIGVADGTWGEAVRACVVRAPGADVGAQDLIDFARDRIAHYKCPSSVVFVDELPRNPSGKILKRELRKLHGDG